MTSSSISPSESKQHGVRVFSLDNQKDAVDLSVHSCIFYTAEMVIEKHAKMHGL